MSCLSFIIHILNIFFRPEIPARQSLQAAEFLPRLAGPEKPDFNQAERNIKIFLAIRKAHGEFMIPQNKEIRNAQKRSSLRKGNPSFQKTENPCFKET